MLTMTLLSYWGMEFVIQLLQSLFQKNSYNQRVNHQPSPPQSPFQFGPSRNVKQEGFHQLPLNRRGRGGLFQQQFTGNVSNYIGTSEIASNTKDSSKIMGFLENTQRVLQVAEEAAPMIQQYTPLIKSLPSMLDLMSETDDEEKETSESEEGTSTDYQDKKQDEPVVEKSESKPQSNKKKSENSIDQKVEPKKDDINKRKKKSKTASGEQSSPRMYI